MLPTINPAPGYLRDVMPSCLAALRGHENPLELPAVRTAIVVLVDGLGWNALARGGGHARFLNRHRQPEGWGRNEIPSTTVVNLTTLATGVPPGVHGLTGYEVLDPKRDRLVKLLGDWDESMSSHSWQRSGTIFETAREDGVTPYALGSMHQMESSFSAAVLRGAHYRGISSSHEGAQVTLRIARSAGVNLVYFYIPSLDKIAHAHGIDSRQWHDELEKVDTELSDFVSRLPADAGVIVTADHGIVDVPHENHILFDAYPHLLEGVRHVGGEPRFLHVYSDDRSSVTELQNRWRDVVADKAWVMTRDEAQQRGLLGKIANEVLPRVGNILVMARENNAFYDASRANAGSRAMIGQHGSVTDDETQIPLIRLGGFA